MLETLLSGVGTGLAQLAIVIVGAYFTAYLDRRLALAAAGEPISAMSGPGGLLQPLADARGILSKRESEPARADHFLFRSAPVIAFGLVFVVFSIVPWDKGLSGRDLNVGLFFFL